MVDLGQIYKEQWQAQFPEFGDGALQTVTYTSVGTPSQDPETGAVTSTDVDYVGLKILYDRKRLEDVPGVTIDDDETGIFFPSLDLAVRPEMGDYYTHSDTQKWRVTGAYPDNFEATWILKVKRFPGG